MGIICKTTEVDQHAKKIRETGNEYAILSSFSISGGGLFTDKDLRDSQLSQLMKHSRKKKKLERRSSWDKTGNMLMINWTISAEKFHHTAGYIFHGLKNWKHRFSVIGE